MQLDVGAVDEPGGAVAESSRLPLYAQVLGDRWERLSIAVQTMHLGALRGVGAFRVSRGRGWIAVLLARCSRLPGEGSEVHVELQITPHGDTERWTRRFECEVLESAQWRGPQGTLMERIGPLELCFELRVEDGALVYDARRVTLRLGAIRIPLPRVIAPRVFAREKPRQNGKGVEVLVSVRMPLVGLVIEYEGTIERICVDSERDEERT